jgi:hypothetical protein
VITVFQGLEILALAEPLNEESEDNRRFLG